MLKFKLEARLQSHQQSMYAGLIILAAKVADLSKLQKL